MATLVGNIQGPEGPEGPSGGGGSTLLVTGNMYLTPGTRAPSAMASSMGTVNLTLPAGTWVYAVGFANAAAGYGFTLSGPLGNNQPPAVRLTRSPVGGGWTGFVDVVIPLNDVFTPAGAGYQMPFVSTVSYDTDTVVTFSASLFYPAVGGTTPPNLVISDTVNPYLQISAFRLGDVVTP